MNNTQFHEEMTKITLAWANQEFDEAFDVIRRILAAGTDAMKAQCLLLSGMIKDDQHNRSEARADWLHALPYAKEGSFVLCSLQHEIGESYAKTGMMDQALSWYKSALITCANGDKFSCEPTLRAFLRLGNGHIPPGEKKVVALAVKKSWEVLELPGSPPLDNLPNAIAQLSEGFSDIAANILGSPGA